MDGDGWGGEREGGGGKSRRIESSRGRVGDGNGLEVVPRPGRRKRVGSGLFGRFSRFKIGFLFFCSPVFLDFRRTAVSHPHR